MSVSMGKWLIFCHFTATANLIETHSDLALWADHLKGLMHILYYLTVKFSIGDFRGRKTTGREQQNVFCDWNNFSLLWQMIECIISTLISNCLKGVCWKPYSWIFVAVKLHDEYKSAIRLALRDKPLSVYYIYTNIRLLPAFNVLGKEPGLAKCFSS